MTAKQRSRRHHYVPQWYQRRFLGPEQPKYHYLDMKPETVVRDNVRYLRRDCMFWGPVRCFYRDDLYTRRIGQWPPDDLETRFFGEIDRNGCAALDVFGNYDGYSDRVREVFRHIPRYMDAQRFRTPRGLDQFHALTRAENRDEALVKMERLVQFHTTMWSEGVWEIVRARNSATKFIVSDEPVTFYNRRIFPNESDYPGVIELDQVGTRTLFPLGPDACLIISHLQFVRNPRGNPNERRANARSYEQTMRYLLDVHFGRELEEQEVIRINYILKKRATRYIAAAQREWLYPEAQVPITDWAKLDDDWFLLPNLYKVPFKTKLVVGSRSGRPWISDEYGRRPGHSQYSDRRRRDKEWETTQRAKREWAKKRAGKAVARIHDIKQNDISDRIMIEDLDGPGTD